MELEKASTTWEPQLKQFARNVLLQKYTLGVVDEMLPHDRQASYEDLARAISGDSGGEGPSILKAIFHEARNSDALLLAWLAADTRDQEIESKAATDELLKLIRARLGLEVPHEGPLSKVRAVTLRYLLASEFRLDLACDPPVSLASVPTPPNKAAEGAVRDLARFLREQHPEAYAQLADAVEAELKLKDAQLPAASLGSIDTFRFEERALLRHASELIAKGDHEMALEVVRGREHSFWRDRDVGRKAQWEACRLMAELGQVTGEVTAEIAQMSGSASAWLEAYTREDGWYRLDQAQRRLEAWLVKLDEEPDERAIGLVRRAYEDVAHTMAQGFSTALAKAGWELEGTLHQTRVFSEVVTPRPRPVAYFLVDAMRFEMGRELEGRLPRTSEVLVQAAVGSLPSITPVGMAALMPGASSSFSVVEQGGKLGARIDDSFLPGLSERKKLAAARVPKLVDFTLDELLSVPASKLAKKLDQAQVVVVRSQEIDHAGENQFGYQARQIMDGVIDNLARGIRKLAAAGIEHAVVSADHGHLFFATDRDESMRTDAPGGNTVDLHRRCWVGRGGATPPGSVRVAASALGYESDLEFVFPAGAGVFRAGGGLAFYHGGPSLQELVVPVLTIRTKLQPSIPPPSQAGLKVSNAPTEVTNRIFSIGVKFEEQIQAGKASVGGLAIKPVLLSEGKEVGTAGMVVGAELDPDTKTLVVPAGEAVTVALILNESPASLRIVILDPATDAELYRSPKEIPVRLGVE